MFRQIRRGDLTLSCVASEPGMENVGFYNMGEVTMNLHREENDRSGVVTMNRWYEHNDNHCSAAEQPGPNHYYYHRPAGYWWIHKLADPLNQEIGPMSDTTNTS